MVSQLKYTHGIVNHRTNNRNFFRRENAITERIFHVILFGSAMTFNGEADQKLKRIRTETWGKLIGFTPNSIFMVAKYENPRFGAKRESFYPS